MFQKTTPPTIERRSQPADQGHACLHYVKLSQSKARPPPTCAYVGGGYHNTNAPTGWTQQTPWGVAVCQRSKEETRLYAARMRVKLCGAVAAPLPPRLRNNRVPAPHLAHWSTSGNPPVDRNRPGAPPMWQVRVGGYLDEQPTTPTIHLCASDAKQILIALNVARKPPAWTYRWSTPHDNLNPIGGQPAANSGPKRTDSRRLWQFAASHRPYVSEFQDNGYWVCASRG